MDIEQATQIKIVDFLASEGFHPASIRGKQYKYISPYRNERSPSFFVNIEKNLWYDFGAGEGGGIIRLAKRLFRTDSTSEVLRHMANRSRVPVAHNKPPCVKVEKEVKMGNITFFPLSHHALLSYLAKRGIDPDIAQIYCKEAYYEIRGKRYFAIAFLNNSGGCELRNPYFKGCRGTKDITTIHNKDMGSKLNTSCVHLFEGFISFLSFLMLILMGKLHIPKYGSSDYIILNTVANVNKVVGSLGKYDRIFTYLDNDEPGKIATDKIVNVHGHAVLDMSFVYHPYNDLNDYLRVILANNKKGKC